MCEFRNYFNKILYYLSGAVGSYYYFADAEIIAPRVTQSSWAGGFLKKSNQKVATITCIT